MSAQAFDRLGHGGVDLPGQADQETERCHVAVSDAADEGTVLVVLDQSKAGRWRAGGAPLKP